MLASDLPEELLPQREEFAQTDWFMIAAAARNSCAESRSALEQLCRIYWYPLYAFVRRQGYRPEDAQDLTQEFFARVIEKNSLSSADRERGKFRTFLLSSLKHFLVNEWEKACAAKRGGGHVISWDQQSAEARYLAEPRHDLSPDRLYEQHWAATLFERVMDRLRAEYVQSGKESLFTRLSDAVFGEKDLSYATIAHELDMSEGAVKVAAHRLRQRCGEMLQAEVAQTVQSPSDVDDEVRYLLHLLSAREE
jgi:RNA polymerase sigma-70 factor (ECF subfamily)